MFVINVFFHFSPSWGKIMHLWNCGTHIKDPLSISQKIESWKRNISRMMSDGGNQNYRKEGLSFCYSNYTNPHREALEVSVLPLQSAVLANP